MRCCCFAWATFTSCSTTTRKTAARCSGLTLTSRDKGENPIPMAGFPHHQLESYLAKLIAGGLRAAVCEQVEDPKLAKGLVKREVTRVVTPGTLTDERCSTRAKATTGRRRASTSAGTTAIAPGMAWVELSTGRFFAPSGSRWAELTDELARMPRPKCLVCRSSASWTAARCRRALRRERGRSRLSPAGRPGHFGLRQRRRARCKSISDRHARRLRLRRRRPACPAGRRRGARLSPRDAEGVAGPHRSARRPIAAASCWRSTKPPAAAWSSPAPSATARREGSLLGRDRPHRHADGRPAAGRLAANPLHDIATRSTPGSTRSPSSPADAALRELLREQLDRRLRPRTAARPRRHRPRLARAT